MTEPVRGEVWYDPFRNNGSYFNQFPADCVKEWSEIEDGRDFFDAEGKVDVICSNPPFSLMNECLDKCVQLQPRVISLLMGCLNLTIPLHAAGKNTWRITAFSVSVCVVARGVYDAKMDDNARSGKSTR